MIAYSIYYRKKNGDTLRTLVDSKNLKYAKKKIERKEKQRIEIIDYSVIGYY